MTLSPTSTQTVTVNFATANGTATAGSDYVAASGTLTFAPGVSTRPISVTVNGDTNLESTETFTRHLERSGQRRPRHGGWHRHHPQRASTITGVVASSLGGCHHTPQRVAPFGKRHADVRQLCVRERGVPRPRRPH